MGVALRVGEAVGVPVVVLDGVKEFVRVGVNEGV